MVSQEDDLSRPTVKIHKHGSDTQSKAFSTNCNWGPKQEKKQMTTFTFFIQWPLTYRVGGTRKILPCRKKATHMDEVMEQDPLDGYCHATQRCLHHWGSQLPFRICRPWTWLTMCLTAARSLPLGSTTLCRHSSLLRCSHKVPAHWFSNQNETM